ncbi:K+/H+ antiporter subunit F [Dokdonella sp.]|uniref:K+/H+ antiporter subunit F n=1 Tax=Dokdonella sp. TaxID=2291710 RepID=UPI0031C8694E|nr:K+/H+ antiporter subunit F [Dokdonella sp.]
MSATLLGGALLVAQLMLVLAMALAGWRLFQGPRAQDRVLAFDALYLDALLLVLTFNVGSASTLYFEVALVMAVFGFVSTVALSKFLLRGEVIE